MKFIVVTKAQAKEIRRALRAQDGLPARGETVGPVKWEPPTECAVDEDGDPLPTPGWSTDNVEHGDEDGEQIAIAVPPRLEKLAGKKVKGVQLPALVAEDELPEGIKTVRARKLAELNQVG